MKRSIILLGIGILITTFVVSVYAHGPGRGRGGGYAMGGGYHMMDSWNGGDSGYREFTENERNAMEQLERRFYETTADPRNRLGSKEAELDALLNVRKPDFEKAKTVQREISALRARLEEKRVEYEIEARRIAPNRMSSYYDHHMDEYGSGRGTGAGPCW